MLTALQISFPNVVSRRFYVFFSISVTFHPVTYTVTEGENEFVELIIQAENPNSNVLFFNVTSTLVPQSAEGML